MFYLENGGLLKNKILTYAIVYGHRYREIHNSNI